jgi:hypothetical protein
MKAHVDKTPDGAWIVGFGYLARSLKEGRHPTVEELDAFLADGSGDAYEKAVDRLLGTAAYGERMAQHWLDVTRYADSSGFSNDYERGNAWRYRDYVVRAFNRDKPSDQFIKEQIAGDEIDANDPEKIIATGFLRTGPWELTGIVVAGTAGLRLGWSLVDTGGMSRLASVRSAAPALYRMVAGAAAMLAVAAATEGFWSASPVPLPAKVAFGVVSGAIITAWLALGGRR